MRPAFSTRSTRRRAGLVIAAALALPAEAGWCASAITFIDRAPGFAFHHEYDGGWEHYVGGGVAVFDCNGDELPDAFVAGGDNPSRLLVNSTAHPGADIAFDDRTAPATALQGVTGAYPVDIDSDDSMDLVVLRVGENLLLRGDGDCGFARANEAWSFDGGARWTTAFSASWERGRQRPTLAFGNYVDRSDPDGPFGACDVNELHRADGQTYGEPLLLEPGYCALSMLFSDWNHQGRVDLRVSNDRHYYVHDGQEQLWRIDGVPRLYGEADGWQPLKIWGMGIASRDITGDGLPEIYLTSMADQKLRVRDPEAAGPTYHDEAYKRRMTAHMPYTGDDGRPSAGWHAAFGDVDNDGLDDLFVAKGNVEQMPDMAMHDPNNLLVQQGDGTFVEQGLAAGLASLERARGAAVVDLNGDGRLDILVVNRRAGLGIYQNVSPATGGWLSVHLDQPPPNRDAVGAWIELRGPNRHWYREVTIGGGHASGAAGPEHFGIGTASEVDIRVTWPDGSRTAWLRTPVDRAIRIVRDKGIEAER